MNEKGIHHDTLCLLAFSILALYNRFRCELEQAMMKTCLLKTRYKRQKLEMRDVIGEEEQARVKCRLGRREGKIPAICNSVHDLAIKIEL